MYHPLREYCTGRLITVFGCGGERSTARRFEQGEVSGIYSDLTIITSDNPRSEDPNEIISHIEAGIKKTEGKYMIEPDRRSAIALAFSLACDDDFVIIAEKATRIIRFSMTGRYILMTLRRHTNYSKKASVNRTIGWTNHEACLLDGKS